MRSVSGATLGKAGTNSLERGVQWTYYREMQRWVGYGAMTMAMWTCAVSLRSERLPIRMYNTTDGLPQDTIWRIFQDSHGYVWFATSSGLSRFDGYAFVNYGVKEGLPGEDVTDAIEAGPGEYWVATTRGICRFAPAAVPAVPGPPVIPMDGFSEAPRIRRLLRDRSGRLWAATDGGLFVLDAADQTSSRMGGAAVFRKVGGLSNRPSPEVFSLFEDHAETLWIGTNSNGLYRRWPDGRMDHYSAGHGLHGVAVLAIAEGPDGRLWAATGLGLLLLGHDPKPGGSIVERFYPTPAPTDNHVWDLVTGSGPNLWLGTSDGVFAFDGGHWRRYSRANGLTQDAVQSLFVDRDANLWIGSASGGVMRVAHSGFTTFDEHDGLTVDGIYSIFETKSGQLCVTTGPLKNLIVNCFDGHRFKAVRPGFPASISYFGWGRNQTALQDRYGEWWIATGQGVVRFAGTADVGQLASLPAKAVYTKSSGLAGNDVFRVFEDTHGDIWISTIDNGGGLTRWERSRQVFRRYGPKDGIPHAVTVFREDGLGSLVDGILWRRPRPLSGWTDHVFRKKRRACRPELYSTCCSTIGAVLWVSTVRGGLARIDDPAAVSLRFRAYTTANGLSGDELAALVEDRAGRIYVTTRRGLDRIDPETDRVTHFTTKDGLATNHPELALRDRNGNLWFGSSQGGLSRLIPETGSAETSSFDLD